ncbi:hypothetical protein BVRB_4g081920 [Beta vulgaris subsp. vulgaris]|nr:hypothetical protein BVRB_4g081920 [Beta vulgaris subsp. vulgaris]
MDSQLMRLPLFNNLHSLDPPESNSPTPLGFLRVQLGQSHTGFNQHKIQIDAEISLSSELSMDIANSIC